MSTTTTSLPTGTWNVDPTHSHVTFSVRHIGISKVRGEFGSYEGQLVIGEDGTLSASGNVKVDSISTMPFFAIAPGIRPGTRPTVELDHYALLSFTDPFTLKAWANLEVPGLPDLVEQVRLFGEEVLPRLD